MCFCLAFDIAYILGTFGKELLQSVGKEFVNLFIPSEPGDSISAESSINSEQKLQSV